jgi:protein ImuB
MNVLSSRRYLSVWLRRLSTDRIERRFAAPDDSPRVVIASIEQAQRIVAMNDAAARLRLKLDMPLADARAMYPSLPVFEADVKADRRLLEAIADWCDRYTPLVGLDPPDGLFLDITGCAHLFNGEATLARDLLTRLKQQGFAARAAVADTPGCAWGVGRCASMPTPSRISRPPGS